MNRIDNYVKNSIYIINVTVDYKVKMKHNKS